MKRAINLTVLSAFTILLCCSSIADARISVRAPSFLPPCNPPTGLIISEFRLRGPGGVHDEFIELYNNTNAALTVCTADGSSGWAVVSSDGTVRFVIPSETTIPARGHLLATGSGYSLNSYAVGDLTYSSNIPDNQGIALFNTANPANFSTSTRLDAVGFTSNAALYREGTGLGPASMNFIEQCFRRNLATGTPADTNNNSADFQYLATDGTFGSKMGAPGPENLSSHIQRNANMSMLLLDTTVAASLPPNRVFDGTSDPANNSTFGTLTVRRRIVNNTGASVSRLRFRVTSITTYPPPNGSTADLRVRTSSVLVNVPVNDSNTCAATGTPASPPCTVTVQATTLEQPPNQPSGGGYNSSLSVALPQPLAAGASVNVQFLLGLQQTGSFHFFLNIEAMTDTAGVRLDPVNQTGGQGEDPLSRNFNWNVPILSLPGRAGMDLGLSLAYNSLVWTRSGAYISFDDDRGFPSPGFRLGFPVIQPLYYNAQAGKNAYLLITPNGDRVELRQVGISGPLFESVDSSYLLLNTSTMTLRTTDGTQLSFDWMGSDFQCTEIKDRNGNFITINYNEFGRINTIVDTLNRTINFNYENNYLSSIKQTWTVNGSTVQHTWASFFYRNPDLTIQTNFQGLTNVGPPNGSTLKVLSKVTINDGSSFTFDYTSWGQVWKISHSAPDGHLRNYRSYNLPLDQATAQTDCPRFTQRLDWARDWNGDTNGIPAANEEVPTGFAAPAAANWTMPDGTAESGTLAQVTLPDGTMQKIYSHATGWDKGLPLLVETHGRSTPGAAVIKQKSVVTKWNQDNLNLPLNPRVEETNVYDFDGSGQIQNRARTWIGYLPVTLPDGTTCKLPQDVKEYQANASTVLRRTHTEYKLTSEYTSRRIIGLVREKTLFEVNPETSAETLMSKVEFEYDEALSLVGNDAPVQHDNTNYTASFLAGRANLTSVKRYDVTNSSFIVTSTIKYNTAGSVVQTTDASNHSVTLSYTDKFAENGTDLDPALSFTTLAYPTTVTDADGYTSSIRYNYDFGAQTWKQTPLPNTIDNTPGPEQKLKYDDKGRLELITNLVNNAYTKFIYGPNYLQSFATVNNVADEARNVQMFDGAGRVIAKVNNHPNSTGGFAAQRLIYDQMGRVHKQSNPTETSISITGIPLQPSDWLATGDDEFNSQTGQGGWLYTQQTYDWKGRPLVTINTDGTTKEASYTGCGCAGGEVVTLTDEGTIDGGVPKRRQQKIYSDILGRMVKTEILNWQGGSVYSATVNTYNARDQVVLIRQFQGTAPVDPNDLSCPSGTCQQTTMAYDGHGRLETRHVPEQNAGTNTVWAYNSDDTIQMITDARGASQTMTYNGRHLVTGVTYAAPAPIPTPSPVTYVYDAAGNRTSMSDGTGTTTHLYDTLSRMTSETRTFQGIPGNFSLTYSYNLAGQLASLTDGFTGQVNYQYDTAGRLLSVGSSGYTASYFNFSTQQLVTQPVSQLISEIEYRAWGSAKQITFGNGVFETANYNARLRPTSYSLNNVRLQCLIGLSCSIPSATMSWAYDYHADGRLNHAFDSENIKFDRRHEFDHVGRYREGYTNREARGLPFDFNEPDPYRHTVQYDVWGNITSRTGRLWSLGQVDTATYTNHRRQSWSYDANGNLIGENSKDHTYNAVGEQTYVRSLAIVGDGTPSFPVNPQMEITQTYDGLGAVARRTQITREEIFEEEVLTNIFTTGHDLAYLRATPLGGVVVAELNIFQLQGQQIQAEKKQINIYAKGQRIAREESEAIKYEAHNPQTGSWVSVNGHSDDRFASREERDPFDADLPLTDPDPSVTFTGGSDGQLYIHGGDPFDLSGGCELDGMPISCSDLQRRMDAGFVGVEYLLRDRSKKGVPKLHPGKAPGSPSQSGWRTETFPIQSYGIGLFILTVPVLKGGPAIPGTNNEGFYWGFADRVFAFPSVDQSVDWAVFDSALRFCISKLWPMFNVTSYKPTEAGGKGGTKNDDKYNGVIGLVDTTTGSHFNVTNDPTPPPNMKALIIQNHARGATDRNNPWWNYAYPAGNLTTRPGEERYPELFGAIGMDFIRVQVHEAGAALSFIREMYHPTPGPVAPGRLEDDGLDPTHPDDGPSLEDCIGKEYYKQMRLTPH